MINSNSARFATAINCIDGRIQLPVINYMRTRFNVDFVDFITEPSPVKAIAQPINSFQIFSIQQRLMFSQEKHGSEHLAVVAHHDCTSNPVEKGKQIEQLRQSLAYVSLWGFKCTVVGLWVNENWEAQEMASNL